MDNKNKVHVNTLSSNTEELLRNLTDGKGNLFFIDTKEMSLQPDDIAGFTSKISDNVFLFKHTFVDNCFSDPYQPFLSLFRQYYNSETGNMERLEESPSVYYFHRYIFSSYIKTGLADRKETMFRHFYRYEDFKTRQSIKDHLCNIAATKPIVMLLQNIHFASISTLKLISYLSHKQMNKPILIVVSFNRYFRFADTKRNAFWDQFLKKVQKSATIHESYQTKNTAVNFYRVNVPDKSEIQANVSNIIRYTRNCLQFTALHECNAMSQLLYDMVIKHKIRVNNEDYIILLLTMSESYYVSFELDKAMLYLNTLLGEALKRNNKSLLTTVYTYMASCNYYKGSYDPARRYVNMALKMSENESNLELKLNAQFVLYEIALVNKVPHREIRKIHRKAMQIADQGGFLRAVMNLSLPRNSEFLPMKQLFANCENGMRIAKEKGDFSLYTALLQYKGILYFHVGSFNKSLAILKRIPAKWQKLHNYFLYSTSYNTIGFYYFIQEKFESANAAFNKAFKLLSDCRYRNEMIITVYNIAILFMYSRQFKQAVLWFKKLISLLEMFNLETFPYHTMNSAYALLGIMYCKTGRFEQANDVFNRLMAQYPSSNDEEKILTSLFTALITYEEGKELEIINYFEECLQLLDKHEKDMIYQCLKKFVLVEYGEFCAKTGNMESAYRVFDDGISLTRRLNHSFYEELLTIKQKDHTKEINRFSFRITTKLDKNRIKRVVRHDDNVKLMHKSMYELNLLNTVQYYIRSQTRRDDLVSMVMTQLFNGFPFDQSVYYEKLHRNWSISYKNGVDMINNKEIEAVLELMGDNREVFISDYKSLENTIVRDSPIHSLIAVKTFKRGEMTGVVIGLTKKKYMDLTEDDLRVMTFVVDQMAGGLERIDLDREIRAKSEALEIVNQELGTKNEFKSKYLANMSHEIRTPLNSILGFIQLLQYRNFDRKYDILEINDHLLGMVESNPDSRVELAPLADYLNRVRGIFATDDLDLKYLYHVQLKQVFEKCRHASYIPSSTVHEMDSLIGEVRQLLIEEDNETDESLVLARKSGEYLLQLINTVLDIAKIEAGRIEINKSMTDINKLIHDLSAQADLYITQKQKQDVITLEVIVADDMPSQVLIDKSKVSQVILNLVSNAVKFTEKGTVTISCKMKKESMMLAVSDTGKGIKKKDLSRLFQEFSRIEESELIEGTGLGLVYSRKLSNSLMEHWMWNRHMVRALLLR
jgi:signal transduction histidine kinase/tetratricopeptide (TPR) repeat protein